MNARPIDFKCAACGARPLSPCTAPTNTSRRPVQWFHFAREHDALNARLAAIAAEQVHEDADELVARGLIEGVS